MIGDLVRAVEAGRSDRARGLPSRVRELRPILRAGYRLGYYGERGRWRARPLPQLELFDTEQAAAYFVAPVRVVTVRGVVVRT